MQEDTLKRQLQRFKRLYAEQKLINEKLVRKDKAQRRNLKYLNRKIKFLYDGMQMAKPDARVPVKVEL